VRVRSPTVSMCIRGVGLYSLPKPRMAALRAL
jgi:hypothetical protein